MVKVLVMSGYGINSEKETVFAFEKFGAKAEIIHINDLIDEKYKMSDYDIMVFPGGFAYGDDTGSGNAYANKLKNNLWEDVKRFISDKKLILGICNGFQVLVHIGLFPLPLGNYGQRNHALIANDSNNFECRPVFLKNRSKKCIFTKDIEIIRPVVSHGEGKFVTDNDTLKALKDNNQVVFTYTDEKGNNAKEKYPENPNGSLNDIAGICDHTGRILGLMPHPERALFSTSLPDYQLEKEKAKRDNKQIEEFFEPNLLIFKNAVEYVR